MATLFLNMQTNDLVMQRWFKNQRNLHQSLRLLLQLGEIIVLDDATQTEIKEEMLNNKRLSQAQNSISKYYQFRCHESDGDIFESLKDKKQRNKYVYRLIYLDILHFGTKDFTTHCFDLMRVFMPEIGLERVKPSSIPQPDVHLTAIMPEPQIVPNPNPLDDVPKPEETEVVLVNTQPAEECKPEPIFEPVAKPEADSKFNQAFSALNEIPSIHSSKKDMFHLFEDVKPKNSDPTEEEDEKANDMMQKLLAMRRQ